MSCLRVLLFISILFFAKTSFGRSQKIVVRVPSGSNQGELVCYENGREVRRTECCVGRNGIVNRSKKREGDGCTPRGRYGILDGMMECRDVESKWPMELFTKDYLWVDDSNRQDYNTLLRDADSSLDGHGERIWKVGKVYHWIIPVAYNTWRIRKGRGSAIFIHIWSGKGSATSGCVAMPYEEMKWLVGWLDRDCYPVIIIK